MPYVLVNVEPSRLGAVERLEQYDYLAEQQALADEQLNEIVENSRAEQEENELAQQQAMLELLDDQANTKPAPKLKSMWPWVAAGAGLFLLIALTSK